jgi:hypothetical protein
MTSPSNLPADSLAALAPADIQLQAARMAQDAFAHLFHLAADGDAAASAAAVTELAATGGNWWQAAADADSRTVRLALLVAGLDQWGLAYSQAFGLSAFPALTALLGALRMPLDAAADARFARQFERIQTSEFDAIDFKVELRRNIHLALWHAMAACDDVAAAHGIGRSLGGMMVALIAQMPETGWRLVADALAHIQIRLLDGKVAADAAAQAATLELFEALRQVLPSERHRTIQAHAGQAVLAWQQTRRAAAHQEPCRPSN